MAKKKSKAFDLDRLSRSEWEMMRICWQLDRATVHDVRNASLASNDRDYRTILTFLSRMAKKGYLHVDKVGKTNFYSPAVDQEAAVGHEIRCFLREVIGEDEGRRRMLQDLLDEDNAALAKRQAKASRRKGKGTGAAKSAAKKRPARKS